MYTSAISVWLWLLIAMIWKPIATLKKPITLCFQLIELFDTFLLEFTYQKECLRIFCFNFSSALATKCGTNLPIHSPFNYRRLKGNWGKGGTKDHVNSMCPPRRKLKSTTTSTIFFQYAWTSVILGAKHDCRRHSTTSFSENVVVAGTSFKLFI